MELGGVEKREGSLRSRDSNKRMRMRYAQKIETLDERELYKHSLSFYDRPPQCNLSLDKFEQYALARLKVLRIIERVNLTSAVKLSEEWGNKIVHDINAQGLDAFHFLVKGSHEARDVNKQETLLECRHFDNISHFLLRLAFAKTEEQRRWFVSLEVDFLRLKLIRNQPNVIDFLNAHDFPGKELTLQTGMDSGLKYKITSASLSHVRNNVDGMTCFKVPFTFAIDLVRQRKVYLEGGWAYVLRADIDAVIGSAFRSYLSESISMVKKNMHMIEQDQRLVRLLDDFGSRHTGNDYTNKKDSSSAITVDQLPGLSQKSFPLCMKSLYDIVSKEHHLKHFGRLQLGLFFKGIGVPLEDATKFWRGNFTKKPEIDGTRFDKQYLYNIRHMYGQEGKRADYTPYSCMKVVTSNVGPGDFHGCPFKHSDAAHLRLKLTDAKIPNNGVKEIMELVEKHHYQIACQKYFEWTHDTMTVEGGVNHPNQYFEESRAVLSGKKTQKAEEKTKTTRVSVYADGRTSQQIKEERSSMDVDVEPLLDSMDDDETNELISQLKF